MYQISLRARYIIVAITQHWVNVVVKIAGLLQWAQTGRIPSATPVPETEYFLYSINPRQWVDSIHSTLVCCVLSLKNVVNLISLT